MPSGKLGEEAGKMLHIPGFDSLMVYVTDLRCPLGLFMQGVQPSLLFGINGISGLQLVSCTLECMLALLKAAIVSSIRTKRVTNKLLY